MRRDQAPGMLGREWGWVGGRGPPRVGRRLLSQNAATVGGLVILPAPPPPPATPSRRRGVGGEGPKGPTRPCAPPAAPPPVPNPPAASPPWPKISADARKPSPPRSGSVHAWVSGSEFAASRGALGLAATPYVSRGPQQLSTAAGCGATWVVPRPRWRCILLQSCGSMGHSNSACCEELLAGNATVTSSHTRHPSLPRQCLC